MPIIEPVIRPPAERDSFLLQVTLGCSSDACTFCGAYKGKPFRVKTIREIFADIDLYARRYPETRRVFLMDGDALVLNNARIIPVLEKLQKAFPKLSRISSYANGSNITPRSAEDLADLCKHQLSLIYMGLESGDQHILDRCGKTSRVDEMITAVDRAAQAGIKSSVIVLLGLGGKEHSRDHIQGTISALNRMQPRYLSFLSLMVIPGTPLADQVKKGEFKELSAKDLLKEAHAIIEGLELRKTVFRSDHASNYLALEGTFPKDKTRLLGMLQEAINGKQTLRPEIFRGL